jgi:hypothetical protein
VHFRVERRPFEQRCVEIWRTAIGGAILLACDGQPLEEQGAESAAVERLAPEAAGRMEGAEVVLVPVEGQPALAFDEPQKHQPAEQHLGERPQLRAAIELARLADERLHALEDVAIILAEAAGDVLGVNRIRIGHANLLARLSTQPEVH